MLNSIWGSFFLAVPSIIDLSIWSPKSTILSFITVGTLLGAYVTVLPNSMKKSSLIPHVHIEGRIDGLSSTVAASTGAMFLVQALFLGLTTAPIFTTALLSIFKCLAWYFTIQTVRILLTSSSVAATNIIADASHDLVYCSVDDCF